MHLKLSRSMNSAATGVWLRARAREHLLDAVQDQRPVRQAGQSVVCGKERKLLLAPLELFIRALALDLKALAHPQEAELEAQLQDVQSLGEHLGCDIQLRGALAQHLGHQVTPAQTAPGHLVQRRRAVAASSPKISQVSWPASMATSRPSPAIQRATAIVELLQIRPPVRDVVRARAARGTRLPGFAALSRRAATTGTSEWRSAAQRRPRRRLSAGRCRRSRFHAFGRSVSGGLRRGGGSERRWRCCAGTWG